MDGRERQSANARPKTPSGLLAFFALLVLVGYQTFAVGQLPSFDLMAASTSASSTNNHMIAIDVTNLSSTAYIRRIPQPPHQSTHQSTHQFTSRQAVANLTTARRGMPLSELTASPEEVCADPMIWITNKEIAPNETWAPQRIPRIIHQTSKSRCIHRAMASQTNHWRGLSTYTYYFHDDAAIWRLINQDWPEFPSLKTALRCLTSMTAVTDVWRILVLWEYGGIYSDLDAAPHLYSNTSWKPSHIYPDDDAYFVVEYYDALSQYWMAVSPRHPLMFYTVHAALARILTLRNVLRMDASLITGPYALLDGFALFTIDAGPMVTKPVHAGLYWGANNRSVRIDGYGRGQSDLIIQREAMKRPRKLELYKSMNMTHFLDDFRAGRQSPLLGRSCLAVLYDIHVGPPEWFVVPPTEDRRTMKGLL